MELHASVSSTSFSKRWAGWVLFLDEEVEAAQHRRQLALADLVTQRGEARLAISVLGVEAGEPVLEHRGLPGIGGLAEAQEILGGADEEAEPHGGVDAIEEGVAQAGQAADVALAVERGVRGGSGRS